MASIQQICSVCGGEFEPRFSYQMEERQETDASGRPRAHFAFFCSQQCLHQSHSREPGGSVSCDACATSSRVELASQVLFSDGNRRYACGADCRKQLVAESRGVRLGEIAAEEEKHETVRPPPASVAEVSSRPEVAASRRNPAAPRVLAVFNHKGGTGKTTTSVTLAAGLAARGARVLLVDTDAQGNVGVSLGVKTDRNLYHVLVMGLPVEQAVTEVRPGLDLLSSNETLAAAELYLAGRKHRDRVLATRLESVREDYDYVIVDCSPSLSLMNQNALVFADAVLCPVACDYLSLVGVRQVLRTVKSVNKLLGHAVRFWGVLPTLYDGRAKICREALETLREHFGDRCFEPVRSAIRVKEAPAHGRTLFEHAPESNAAVDYQRVVERLLDETKAVAAPNESELAVAARRISA